MSFIDFIQLLLRNKKWVILFPMLTGITIFVFTLHMPRTFSSEMVIYTGLASGYNVDNDMSGKIDYHEANSKFDNLINTLTSRETKKEVALQLLATILQDTNQLKYLITTHQLNQQEWLVKRSEIDKVRGNNLQQTYSNLLYQLSFGSKNSYYQLIFGKEPNPFNMNCLSAIKANRLGFSDMVKVEYTCEDAFLTKKTLDILSEVFMKKYKGMRIGEVSSVVKYFEEQTSIALQRLQKAELILKSFRTTNRVINYYEQTKYIADQKEDIEKRQSQLEMDLKGYQSAVQKIETKLDSRILVKLKSNEVLQARNNLAAQTSSIGLAQVKNRGEGKRDSSSIELLRRQLKNNIDDLYDLNNSTEGIPGKDLLDQWLNLTVNVDENQAKLTTLNKNKTEFNKVYDHFAPMGSDLNKLERDVDVSEKEYLNLLHNLNQAKLRERNLVVTENISITDPPDMPITPNASKRLLLIIASIGGCFFLVIVVLLLIEYLDESISNPLNFLNKTGIQSATAFASFETLSQPEYDEVNTLSYERWALSLSALTQQSNGKAVKVLAIPFHKSIVDYSSLIEKIRIFMNSSGNNWSTPLLSESTISNNHQLMLASTANRELIHQEVLQQCDKIYLFINAALKLDDYHTQLLSRWKELHIPIQVVMLNTGLYHLEKFLGELPKQRSLLRRAIKKIIKRYS